MEDRRSFFTTVPRCKNNWVGLKLVGAQANLAATGALIKWSANGQVRSRLKTGGGSFLSSHDPREILGLGKAGKVDWVEIRWPKPSRGLTASLTLPSTNT